MTKKWWYHQPYNSDNTSKLKSLHWSNNFKGLYEKKKINHVTTKMDYNHRKILYNPHILKHREEAFPYFDYEKNNYAPDSINLISNTKKQDNTVELKIVLAEDKAMKDAENK